MELVSVDFHGDNQKIAHNYGSLLSSLAALYAFKSHLRLDGEILVELNRQNAFVLDCTILYIEGVAKFLNNTGESYI